MSEGGLGTAFMQVYKATGEKIRKMKLWPAVVVLNEPQERFVFKVTRLLLLTFSFSESCVSLCLCARESRRLLISGCVALEALARTHASVPASFE